MRDGPKKKNHRHPSRVVSLKDHPETPTQAGKGRGEKVIPVGMENGLPSLLGKKKERADELSCSIQRGNLDASGKGWVKETSGQPHLFLSRKICRKLKGEMPTEYIGKKEARPSGRLQLRGVRAEM